MWVCWVEASLGLATMRHESNLAEPANGQKALLVVDTDIVGFDSRERSTCMTYAHDLDRHLRATLAERIVTNQ